MERWPTVPCILHSLWTTWTTRSIRLDLQEEFEKAEGKQDWATPSLKANHRMGFPFLLLPVMHSCGTTWSEVPWSL